MEQRVNEALKAKFRPEFLNRLDDQIIFRSLEKEELRRIVSLQVERLRGRLEQRKGPRLERSSIDSTKTREKGPPCPHIRDHGGKGVRSSR